MSSSLDSRYGTANRRQKLPRSFWISLAVIASVIGIAFVGWVQLHQASSSPDFRDISHNLKSDDEVTLTFEVVKDPESTAICALKALNEASAPVGWTEVTIGPNSPEMGDSTVRQQTSTVRVLSTATTVTVDRCWNAG